MMKTRLLIIGAAVAAIALMQPLGAASTSNNVTVSATVAATAKLTLGATTVSFDDKDPDTVSSIAANEGAISIVAKGKTSAGSDITLTLQAADDLKSGSDIIGIGNVTWTASGTGFAAGTMSKSSAITVGSWANSGNRTGSVSFALANSWAYATGNYSVTATYTLTAP
jgi:hypothetical protein